ncbi:MAG: hypothetical protein ACE5HD_02490 [Acidobacteriota bacterium]
MECNRCHVDDNMTRLQFCPTCRKPVCSDCLHLVGGKGFCSKACGYFFFYGEGEDDDEDRAGE